MARPRLYSGNNRAIFRDRGANSMKTIDLSTGKAGALVTLELNEYELTVLVALVEQGKQRLHGKLGLHKSMAAVADEFGSLLGHLELLAADD